MSSNPSECPAPEVDHLRGVAAFREKLTAPVDNSLLIFFRVFFGAMMVFHCASMLSSGWIDALYITPEMNFTYPGFGWVKPLPGGAMYLEFCVMMLAAAFVTAGFFCRPASLVLLCCMTHVFLIEKSFYLNHYYLICLLCGLLVVLPVNRSFAVDALLNPQLRAETCAAWCLWFLRLHLAIPYFYGGLAKLDPDWLQGFPMEMWLGRRDGLPWLTWLMQYSITPLLFSYGGLLLDLFIVPLLLWKRTRIITYAAGVLFHLINASIFDIGIFPWLMIGLTLIFFSDDWPRRLLRKPSAFQNESNREHFALPHWSKLTLLSVYLTWQLLFPFRCLLYPGSATWTEEGHHFAWHMMLREKDVGIRFYIRDRTTGKGGIVDLRTFLTSRQLSRMAKDPDMILTFAHFLRDHYRDHGQESLQIRVLAIASLNGRKPQLLIDPERDYATTERTFGHQPWIIPLHEPLRKEPWSVPLNEWESHLNLPSQAEMIQESPTNKNF